MGLAACPSHRICIWLRPCQVYGLEAIFLGVRWQHSDPIPAACKVCCTVIERLRVLRCRGYQKDLALEMQPANRPLGQPVAGLKFASDAPERHRTSQSSTSVEIAMIGVT